MGLFSQALLVVVIAFGGFLIFNGQQSTTVDDFDYSSSPPLFVWEHILPLLGRFQQWVLSLQPPFFQIMSELNNAQLPYLLVAACDKDIPDLLLAGPKTVQKLSFRSKTVQLILFSITVSKTHSKLSVLHETLIPPLVTCSCTKSKTSFLHTFM